MVLLIIGFVVPFVGLLILLFWHDRAMKTLKSAGIKVGFMGAEPKSI
jgi:hypothetical protein